MHTRHMDIKDDSGEVADICTRYQRSMFTGGKAILIVR